MIHTSPTDTAEAALLGRILLDEEDRAHGHTHRPRLLEQVRHWGITSSGLFGRGYHADLWTRIQELAARGESVTRQSVHGALAAAAEEEPAPGQAPAPHAETAQVTHLLATVDTAEATFTSTERCAGMVMDGAMHRSVHQMAVSLARATAGESGEVARTVQGHQSTLQRMRQVWERLPNGSRADLQILASPPPTPLAQAQEELGRARSWVAELRRDPGYAAQMAAEPAWNLVERLLGVVDTLASASVDAPRSPDPKARRFHAPGEILPDQDDTAAARDAHDAEQREEALDHTPGHRAPMVAAEADQIAFTAYDQRRQDPDRQADRQDREARLLGSLLVEPDQLDGDAPIVLEPDSWSRQRQPVVELINDIHTKGLAVDRLTLDWAAQHRGVDIAEEAIAEPLQPREAQAGLAEHVDRDHAEQRVEHTVERLRALGTEPTTGPEDLLTRAATALDEVGLAPPELEQVLGAAHTSEAAHEDEQEAPVPRTRACDDTPHAQDSTVLEHR